MFDFLKRRRHARDEIALTIVQDGRRRDVTVGELAVGTKLAHDAMVQLLVERGVITHEDLRDRIRRISEEHYRGGEPPDGGGKA